MSIFYAIGHLIELVTNMAKPPPKESSGSSPSSSNSGGGEGSKKTPTCPPPPPKSSTSQPSNEGGDEGGDDFGVSDLLPDINLNVGGDEDEGENEPGKTFIEILFSFVLDPLTAIIKGIIKMVELAIITVNIAMHLGKCAKWFVVYVFCTLVYIPISMVFALLNLSVLETKIWKTLYAVDAALFCVISKVRGQGFHIAKFSDDIRSVCFLETVKPTNCSNKTSGKKKKSKSFNLANLLGSQLFLFLVILFVCALFFILGRGATDIPTSFIVFFGIIVLIMTFMIVATFTSYILYMFILLILPIALFVLSFFFGYIPYTLFENFFNKEKVNRPLEMGYLYYILVLYYIQYGVHAVVGIFMFIFKWTMDKINPLPVIIQYLISAACIFVTLMLIMMCIALLSTPYSNKDNSPYAVFVESVHTAFSP